MALALGGSTLRVTPPEQNPLTTERPFPYRTMLPTAYSTIITVKQDVYSLKHIEYGALSR